MSLVRTAFPPILGAGDYAILGAGDYVYFEDAVLMVHTAFALILVARD
jgi:hypothetical protein